jgi:hypothetical protein
MLAVVVIVAPCQVVSKVVSPSTVTCTEAPIKSEASPDSATKLIKIVAFKSTLVIN